MNWKTCFKISGKDLTFYHTYNKSVVPQIFKTLIRRKIWISPLTWHIMCQHVYLKSVETLSERLPDIVIVNPSLTSITFCLVELLMVILIPATVQVKSLTTWSLSRLQSKAHNRQQIYLGSHDVWVPKI